MRVIVGAVISLTPFSAGMAWNWMHLALGLRLLGHEVHYVEEVQADWCVDDSGLPCSLDESVNRRLFQQVLERFGLTEHATQIEASTGRTCGLSPTALRDWARTADLLVNMSGHVRSPLVMDNVHRRAYVDQDPVYTQLWRTEYGKDLEFDRHDAFLTVGLNIGTEHTSIPDCGLRWHPMLPPVVLSCWPFEPDETCDRFTTVASWKGYRNLSYQGVAYGSKAREFERFAALPRVTGQRFEAAVRRHSRDDPRIALLRENGWDLTDAARLGDLEAYQQYIRGSRGEIGIARNAYVSPRSGWFSDRSAHYLACGKPVLAQSTGFERCLPTGRGLLTFTTLEEAAAGVEAINADYLGQCRAAREFAAEYLEYTRSIPPILEACLA